MFVIQNLVLITHTHTHTHLCVEVLCMWQGLASLSLCSYLFLLEPRGCGDKETPCGSHSGLHLALFYISIYLIALGNGGYQPNIATFGADQFDEEDSKEGLSKIAFFSYFYLALNLGSLFSNTVLGYFEDKGLWTLGFWASAGSAFIALVLFLCGTPRYRHYKPSGNPLSRFCQVIISAARKWKVEIMPTAEDNLYEEAAKESSQNGARKMLHTQGFKYVNSYSIKKTIWLIKLLVTHVFHYYNQKEIGG